MEELLSSVPENAEKMVRIMAQRSMIIALRAVIRPKLEAVDDNGEPKFSDEEVIQAASEWQPSLKTSKSKEEKLADMLKSLDPEAAKAAFAAAGIEL